MNITVIMHEAEECGYWAEVPAIQGCFTQAETYDELIENIHEAIDASMSVDVNSIKLDEKSKVLELAI
jgi:predicted RNase H-like HicB family nuclease